MSVGNGVRWLHPAGSGVERLNTAGRHAQLSPITNMTLSSALPLNAEHFHETLQHLQRKIPCLRTCHREKDNTLWVCEELEPKMDFQVIDNADIQAETDKLVMQPYDKPEEGPLWLARLLLGPGDTTHSLPASKEFPYQYNFLFSFHHGIADGISSYMIVSTFLKLLEDVATGSYISPDQLAILLGDEPIAKLEKETLRKLESDPVEFQRMIDEAANAKFTPLLEEAFGIPKKEGLETEDVPSRLVRADLDSHMVHAFHERCRSQGITLNSGLSSVINLALVELVSEAGLRKDVYSVTSRHAVNQRRYFDGHSFTNCGTYMGSVDQTFQTPLYDKNLFWESAKQWDIKFRQKLKEGYIFKERIIKSKIRPKDFTFDSYFSSTPPTKIDYLFSNLLIPQKADYGTGKIVRLTDYFHTGNISNCEQATMHMVARICDRFTYNLIYATSRVSPKTAQAFLDKILVILSRLSS